MRLLKLRAFADKRNNARTDVLLIGLQKILIFSSNAHKQGDTVH